MHLSVLKFLFDAVNFLNQHHHKIIFHEMKQGYKDTKFSCFEMMLFQSALVAF